MTSVGRMKAVYTMSVSVSVKNIADDIGVLFGQVF